MNQNKFYFKISLRTKMKTFVRERKCIYYPLGSAYLRHGVPLQFSHNSIFFKFLHSPSSYNNFISSSRRYRAICTLIFYLNDFIYHKRKFEISILMKHLSQHSIFEWNYTTLCMVLEWTYNNHFNQTNRQVRLDQNCIVFC